MPRAPHFMPLLLLLLLLSLPHTQAVFPQDPLPLLTSDLQGECLLPTLTFSEQVESGTRCRKAPSLQETKSLTNQGDQTGRASWYLRSVFSHLWASQYLEAVLLGG